jgi:hypothetical protein
MNAVSIAPSTGNGWLPYRNLDLGITGQVIKAGQGKLGGYYISNAAASERYVKFYNKATAPTSADTPVLTLAIPATAAANMVTDAGVSGFTAGLSVRASTALADSDNTAPTANDVTVNIFYA